MKDNMDMEKAVQMTVSPVCAKDGKKYAFVSFTEGERTAEGKIPDCVIVSNKGFEKGEVKMLEEYMRRELPQLKKMASGIRLLDAIMK